MHIRIRTLLNSGVIREHVTSVSFRTADKYVAQQKLSQKIMLRGRYKMTASSNHPAIRLLMCLNDLKHVILDNLKQLKFLLSN